MNQTRTMIESPAWALAQLEQFEHATQDYAGASAAAADARAEAQRVREELKAIEAEIVVNGGYERYFIDGKNAETRAAQTLAACQAMPKWREVTEYLRKQERLYAEAENEMQEATNVMRRIRLALDFASAWMAREAAIERGSGMEERANGYRN